MEKSNTDSQEPSLFLMENQHFPSHRFLRKAQGRSVGSILFMSFLRQTDPIHFCTFLVNSATRSK